MRTNIVIDDDLMQEALRRSGLQTKKDVVHAALEAYVRSFRQRSAFERMKGAFPDYDVTAFEDSRGHTLDEYWEGR